VGVGRALIQDPEIITKLSRLRKPRRPSEVMPPIPVAEIDTEEPEDEGSDEGKPDEGKSDPSDPLNRPDGSGE
jgi:hypothetical protein